MDDYVFTPEQMCLFSLARYMWRQRKQAKKNRLPFGEETITETFLLELAGRYPGNVIILPFNKYKESKIGADWAWAFRNAHGNANVPMLVQAKLLDFHDYEYPEIKRRIGGNAKKVRIRQIDQLLATAQKFGIPAVYAFYNHVSDTSRIPRECGTLSRLGLVNVSESWGISVADAYRVRDELDDQTFDTHRVHSIPLHCLLCSRGTGTYGPDGSPELALRALKRLRSLGKDDELFSDSHRAAALPSQPVAELPSLFTEARDVLYEQDPAIRERRVRNLAREFPEIAGVVIMRDSEAAESI